MRCSAFPRQRNHPVKYGMTHDCEKPLAGIA
jgi:hypothetical protein